MTIKQKLAVKEITEKHRPVSVAMKEVGYKPNTYSKPSNLTDSKGWAELMEKYLPDNDVLIAHQQGLKATKIFSSHTEPDKEIPDHPTRLKAVELAYRVKRKLESGVSLQVNNIIGFKKEEYGI